jgi:hypothetical protein
MHRLFAPSAALSAVLLVACASSASAEPSAPAPPRQAPATPAGPPAADGCKPTGAVLFEIDHKVDPGAKFPTSEIKLYASGAWTKDSADGDGKPQPRALGCHARPDIKPIADALHAAPWKITTARIHCMAMSPQFTEYRVDGKLVFTQKLCGGQSLDDKSRAALDKAIALVEPPDAAKPAP